MYTMKQVCAQVGMSYEALKFYCNQGLVPGVQRDERNRRVFDDHDVAWIKSLSCLKKCGMSIEQMKEYLTLCLQGEASIPARQTMLTRQKEALQLHLAQLQESLDFIEWKQQFYEDVLAGRVPYHSNLLQKGRGRGNLNR